MVSKETANLNGTILCLKQNGKTNAWDSHKMRSLFSLIIHQWLCFWHQPKWIKRTRRSWFRELTPKQASAPASISYTLIETNMNENMGHQPTRQTDSAVSVLLMRPKLRHYEDRTSIPFSLLSRFTVKSCHEKSVARVRPKQKWKFSIPLSWETSAVRYSRRKNQDYGQKTW